jgi:hypothetical protein
MRHPIIRAKAKDGFMLLMINAVMIATDSTNRENAIFVFN